MTLDIRILSIGCALGLGLMAAPQVSASFTTITVKSPRAGGPGALRAVRMGFDDPSAGGAGGSGDQPPADGPPNGGAPFSGDQLTQQYSSLSPEIHAAVTNLLETKGADSLSSMSESDARSTFEGLPADVKAQLQAKWDALSDEQRVALKNLGPEAIKQMLSAQLSQMVQRTMAPVMKPMQDAVAGTKAVVGKTRAFMHRSREAVQGWISRFRANHDGGGATQASE